MSADSMVCREREGSTRSPLLVCFIGLHRSGKTSSIETLIRTCRKEGHSVASVKLMQHSDIPIDTEGKDTWRHIQAGSEVVAAVTHSGTLMLTQDNKYQSLEGILSLIPHHIDIVILEGRPEQVSGKYWLNEVVCLKGIDDAEETFRVRTIENPVAFSGVFSKDFKKEAHSIVYYPLEKRIGINKEPLKELTDLRVIPVLDLTDPNDALKLLDILRK
ncbi:MAG: molybdopterin-guanine dinucleotide biosynthesis protein MobB [Thermoplasmata archaeon]